MKKILLIALVILSLNVKAQTNKPIDSFLGIKFGSSAAQVTEGLNAKGATLEKKNSTSTFMVYNDVTLAGRKPFIFYVRFVDDKAFQATFLFKPEDVTQIVKYYDTLKDDISQAYGKGRSYRKIKEPFTESTVYFAFATGDADFSTYWVDGDNAVSAKINKDRYVELSYQDGVLFDLNKKNKKEKEKSEF